MGKPQITEFRYGAGDKVRAFTIAYDDHYKGYLNFCLSWGKVNRFEYYAKVYGANMALLSLLDNERWNFFGEAFIGNQVDERKLLVRDKLKEWRNRATKDGLTKTITVSHQ